MYVTASKTTDKLKSFTTWKQSLVTEFFFLAFFFLIHHNTFAPVRIRCMCCSF